MPAVAKAFESISLAQVSKSGFEGKTTAVLRDGDQITMNRDRLLADAKARTSSLAGLRRRSRRVSPPRTLHSDG